LFFLYLLVGTILSAGTVNSCDFIIPVGQAGVVKAMFDVRGFETKINFHIKGISIQDDSISVSTVSKQPDISIVFNLYPKCPGKKGIITTKKFAITVDLEKTKRTKQVESIISAFVELVKSRESIWQWKKKKARVNSRLSVNRIKNRLKEVESDIGKKPADALYNEIKNTVKTIPESLVVMHALAYSLLIRLGHKKDAEKEARKISDYFAANRLTGNDSDTRSRYCSLSMAYALENKNKEIKDLRKKCINDEGLQGKDCNFLCAIGVLIAKKRFKTVKSLIILDINERKNILPEGLWKQYIRNSFMIKDKQTTEFLIETAALRFPGKHWLGYFRDQLKFGNNRTTNKESIGSSLRISAIYISLLVILIAGLLIYNSHLMRRETGTTEKHL